MKSQVVDEPILVVVMNGAGELLSIHGPKLTSKLQSQLQQSLGRAPDWWPQDRLRAAWAAAAAANGQRLGPIRLEGSLPDLDYAHVEWAIDQMPGSADWAVGAAYLVSSLSAKRAAQESLSQGALVEPCRADAALLKRITHNIRRTLDLETIWQQTIDGLGSMFCAQRVLVCGYQAGADSVAVTAEYCRDDSLAPLPERRFDLGSANYLRQALAKPTPIIESVVNGEGAILMRMAIATRYQDQPNGVIVMYAQRSAWSEADLDLIAELADQVGTAVAHARRFGESHALAVKLQQANVSLMEKHRQLEEARRQAEAAREQAEEASRLKSEFLANTSHELRTPLNGMIGFLKLVLDGMADDPEEQEEFIKEAHSSAIHLLDLINDVLDIAKIEAGKMQIDMGPVSLRELFNAVEKHIRPQAERKGLQCAFHMPLTRDEIILNGNYQRLRQVMLNLLSNALKFTHEGSIIVSAEIKPQKIAFKDLTWPGVVKVSVADTGIGVSLEKQDRLFQTFSQVDGDRTRQYGGTGLGLVISQKLVEAMGGVVQFISMGEGLGSTVTFTVLLYHEPVVISPEPV